MCGRQLKECNVLHQPGMSGLQQTSTQTALRGRPDMHAACAPWLCWRQHSGAGLAAAGGQGPNMRGRMQMRKQTEVQKPMETQGQMQSDWL